MVSTHTYDSSSNNIITHPVQQLKQREKREYSSLVGFVISGQGHLLLK